MTNDNQYSEQILTNTNTSYNSISNNTDQQNENHHQDNYNNYYYNTHVTGRFLNPEQCEAIKQAYIDNISDSLTAAVANMIESAFKHGLEANEIVMAIEETGFAPRPSPAYLRRVLENWVENGVTVSKIRHEVSANRGLPWWK